MFQKGIVSGRIIRLPVSSVPKSFDDLTNKKRTRYVTTVSIPCLPDDKIPSDPNPRNHTVLTSSKLAGLKDSIIENSGNFVFKNLGITILADKTSYDAKNKLLTIDLGKKGGVSNGNTTLNYCQEYGREASNEHVLLTVFTNITDDDDIIEMAEGQNTSINVDKASLLNLDNQFEHLKNQLAMNKTLDKVSFVQNDKKDIDVKYLIRLLVALKPNNNKETRLRSYTSASSCIDKYIDHKSEYDLFANNMGIITQLNDLIKTKSKECYNKGTKGNALALSCFTKNNDKRVFFQDSATETLSDSVFFPILSAYRCLFEFKNGKYSLNKKMQKKGLLTIVEDTVGTLIDECRQGIASEKGNLNAFGKTSGNWDNLEKTVKLYTKE